MSLSNDNDGKNNGEESFNVTLSEVKMFANDSIELLFTPK